MLILDLHALFHRSRNAIERRYPLTGPNGESVSGTYGTLRVVKALLKKYKPLRTVAAFDAGGNFRKQMSSTYKSNRKPGENGFYEDLSILKKILPHYGIDLLGIEGFEADDIVASTTCAYDEQHLVVTVDKDLLALLTNPKVEVLLYNTAKKQKTYNAEAFKKEYGFDPKLYPLYKAIIGDGSDCIEGIKGFGHKRTLALFEKHDPLSDFSKATKQIIRDNLALITMVKDIDVYSRFKDKSQSEDNKETRNEYFRFYNMKSLLEN